MAVNKRLIGGAAAAPGALVPSEHFGVVLYEGDGSSSHSINGGKFGAGAYYQPGNYITHGLSGPTEMSLSIWINAANFSSNSWDNTDFWIFSVGADAAAGSITALMFRSVNDGYLKFGRNSNDGGAITSSVQMSANTWNHCVFTYTGGNSAKIYLNGSQVASGTFTTTQTSTISPGAANTFGGVGGSYHLFEGKIDQARVFYKELSSSEVSTLYAETASTVESLDPLSEDTTDTLQVLGDSSCIATYRFENDEVDLSGNYNGTGTAIQYAAGRYGQAASFNGTNSKIELPSALSDGITTDANCISFWFNVGAEVTSSTSNNEIMSFAYSGGSTGKIALGSTTGNFADETFSVTSDVTSQYTYSKTNIPAGWNHAVVQWNSSNTKWDIYINGVAHTTYTFGTNEQGKLALKFGERSTLRYTGKLDQVRVFNKALSASEITTLYNENSLVASYRFEGNSLDDTRNYDGTAVNVTYEYGLGFTPDLVWIKIRDAASNHVLINSTRGVQKYLGSNTTSAEATSTDQFTSFDTGGFTLGANAGAGGNTNQNGNDYVAWCWKANGGTTSSNTDGTNITSTVQVNSDAGFSIVKWTGDGNASSKVGHGLGVKPDMIISKALGEVNDWNVNHVGIPDKIVYLQSNIAAFSGGGTNGLFGYYSSNTTTTFEFINGSSSVDNVNKNNIDYIAYCFHSVEGFSKFGSYVGNGTTTGPIVETGFEPAFILIKDASGIDDWAIVDNKRATTNPRQTWLRPSLSNAEFSNTVESINFYSNGFQVAGGTSVSNFLNENGNTFIYMAFAADPDTEAPTVAKSFSTVTYTGTNAAQSITGLGFKPGLVWWKNRTGTNSHALADIVRGANKYIHSDGTQAQNVSNGTSQDCISFDNDGFSVGTVQNAGSINTSGGSIVAWAWKADDNEPTLFGGDAAAVYKFEDNYNDVTGTYNGSGTSGTSFISGGKFNKAVAFSGTSSNMDTGITSRNFESWSFWFKPGSSNTGGRVLVCTNTSGDVGQNLEYNGSNSLYIADILGGATNTSASVTIDLRDGDWHHIVITKTATKVRVYVDKVEKLSINNASGSSLQSGNEWSFGKGNYGLANSDFNIDQARYYQGVLEQEDIDKLYNETTSDNDDLTLGAPKETIISANANAGFSIVKYEGDGVAGKKVPHGLSAAPEMIIIKNLDTAGDWVVGHTSLGFSANKFLKLNLTSSEFTNAAAWASTNPTSTTFTLGSGSLLNNNGDNHIAYCFHSVSNYSKFGSYSGSSSTVSVNVGFQPDFIMIRMYNVTGGRWIMIDSVRGDGGLGSLPFLQAQDSVAETTNSVYGLEFTSTGFDAYSGTININSSGYNYIYMAFKIN